MKLRIIFPSVLLLFLVIMIITTLQYTFEAKLMPLVIAVPTAVLVAVQVLKELRVKTTKKESTEGEATGAGYLKAGGWMAALLLSVYLVGYTVTSPLFTFLYLKLHGVSWRVTALCTALIIVIIFVLFRILLEIPLYNGIFFS